MGNELSMNRKRLRIRASVLHAGLRSSSTESWKSGKSTTKTGWNNGSTTLDGVLSQPCDDTAFTRAIQARVVAKARQHGRLELTVKELVVKRGAASHYLQLHNRTGGIPPVLNVKPEVVRTTAGHQPLSSTSSKAPITLSGICDWKKSRSLRCSRSSVRSPGIAATP